MPGDGFGYHVFGTTFLYGTVSSATDVKGWHTGNPIASEDLVGEECVVVAGRYGNEGRMAMSAYAETGGGPATLLIGGGEAGNVNFHKLNTKPLCNGEEPEEEVEAVDEG